MTLTAWLKFYADKFFEAVPDVTTQQKVAPGAVYRTPQASRLEIIQPDWIRPDFTVKVVGQDTFVGYVLAGTVSHSLPTHTHAAAIFDPQDLPYLMADLKPRYAAVSKVQ